jgi:hypothetical protein
MSPPTFLLTEDFHVADAGSCGLCFTPEHGIILFEGITSLCNLQNCTLDQASHWVASVDVVGIYSVFFAGILSSYPCYIASPTMPIQLQHVT